MRAIELCRTAALGGHVEGCPTAASSASPTTPAATGIARSARARRAPGGSPRGRPSCCRSPISTSCSRCRRRSAEIAFQNKAGGLRHPVPGRGRDAAHDRRRSRGISAPRSASSPCCTPGARTCTTIRTSTASSPAAARRSTARAGSPAGRASSCRCACSRASSGASSSRAAGRLRGRRARASRRSRRPGRPRRVRPPARASCAQTEWVVYAKPPFGGPAQVLKYLARYTHRVAITNIRGSSA